jgi:electron transfer flavoprotein alpha subunit
MAETILVIAEQREGKLNRVSLETIVGAQALAKQAGWQVEAALVSGGNAPVDELKTAKLARLYSVEGPELAQYTPDGFVGALKSLIEAKKPKLVLLPHTYQVRDFAPKLAANFGAVLVSDATGAKFEGGKVLFMRQMFQGKFTADVALAGDGPWFVSFQSGAYRADQLEAGVTDVETIAAGAATIRTKPEAPFQEAKQAVDLSQAEIIVSVGRGIKEQKNIAMAQALADALGGEIAASRPICDAGWLPMERQVGSSGQTVSPKLYLALGISGAIQHIVGMKGSKTIIAINKDAEAPIFEVADVAVVGNLFDIVPALTEEIKKAKA